MFLDECCTLYAAPAGVLFFIQLLPVTICCFEYHKWQQQVRAQVLLLHCPVQCCCHMPGVGVGEGGWSARAQLQASGWSTRISPTAGACSSSSAVCTANHRLPAADGLMLGTAIVLSLQEAGQLSTGGSKGAGGQQDVSASDTDKQLALPATEFPHEFRWVQCVLLTVARTARSCLASCSVLWGTCVTAGSLCGCWRPAMLMYLIKRFNQPDCGMLCYVLQVLLLEQ